MSIRNFFAAIRPLLYLTLWGTKRRVLVDGRAYRDYFSMRMQFDTTMPNGSSDQRPLSAAGDDYLDRLSTTVSPVNGTQGNLCSMNLIRRFQLSRDRSVTVANLVDELLCEGGLRGLGRQRRPFRLLNCTPRSARSMPSSATRSGLRPGELVAIYRSTIAPASTGFWPSSAPAASRYAQSAALAFRSAPDSRQ